MPPLTEKQALDAVAGRDLQVVRDGRGRWSIKAAKGPTLVKDAATLPVAVEAAVVALDAETARDIAGARESWLRELERRTHPRPRSTGGGEKIVWTWALWTEAGEEIEGGSWSAAAEALAAMLKLDGRRTRRIVTQTQPGGPSGPVVEVPAWVVVGKDGKQRQGVHTTAEAAFLAALEGRESG